MKKYIGVIVCVILAMAILGLTSCRRDAGDYGDWDEDGSFRLPMTGGGRARGNDMLFAVSDSAPEMLYAVGMEPSNGTAGQVEWEDIAGSGQRHIIQTADIHLETEYFDDNVAALRRLAPSVDGYIESENLSMRGQRIFAIVLRVPAATFDDVVQKVAALANVTLLNQYAQDVTDSFYDMAGSLEIRRIEEERILNLIDGAETVQERLSLEQRLGDVRLVIELYVSQLNTMAGQIAYSTIIVTLVDISEEEYIAVVPTLGERIGGAFGDSVDGTVRAFQNLIVFMAGAIIPLILLALLGLAAYPIIRLALRKRNL